MAKGEYITRHSSIKELYLKREKAVDIAVQIRKMVSKELTAWKETWFDAKLELFALEEKEKQAIQQIAAEKIQKKEDKHSAIYIEQLLEGSDIAVEIGDVFGGIDSDWSAEDKNEFERRRKELADQAKQAGVSVANTLDYKQHKQGPPPDASAAARQSPDHGAAVSRSTPCTR